MTVLISVVWKIIKKATNKSTFRDHVAGSQRLFFIIEILAFCAAQSRAHTHADHTKTSKIAVCFPLGPFHTAAPTWWGVWVERQVNRGQEWKQRERERTRKRRTCRKTDPESILIISAAAAAWLADVREEWTRPTVMLQSKGAATIKGRGGRLGLALHGCLCVWKDVPG